jgi:hypothetical protein
MVEVAVALAAMGLMPAAKVRPSAASVVCTARYRDHSISAAVVALDPGPAKPVIVEVPAVERAVAFGSNGLGLSGSTDESVRMAGRQAAYMKMTAAVEGVPVAHAMCWLTRSKALEPLVRSAATVGGGAPVWTLEEADRAGGSPCTSRVTSPSQKSGPNGKGSCPERSQCRSMADVVAFIGTVLMVRPVRRIERPFGSSRD